MKLIDKLKQSLPKTSTKSTKKTGSTAGKGRTRAATTRKNTARSKSKKPVSRGRKPSAAHGAATPPDVWWERWRWYLHPHRFKDWWFTKPGGLAALRILGVLFGIFLLALVALFLYFAKDLPSPGQINARQLEQTTRFYDRTGEHVLYEVYGDQNRTFIDLDDMGPYVADATIAVEDRNFYRQGAFSSLGILRAAIYNVLNIDRGGLQGGSTITQQYVKNALLSNEQTLTRKIKELILSIQIEQLYDKDDILELYLNEIGYGAQAYGVQAASEMYFSKDAEDLTLDEAAMLAALPQAPTFYSPYGENADALLARMHTVLDLMVNQGYITQEEADEAKETDTLANINATPDAYRDIKAPHFVIRTQRQLEERYGAQEVIQGGWRIKTTIDLDMQEKAEEAVAGNIDTIMAGGGNNAALVASDPRTSQVLAMVGSHDFNEPGYGAYNAATARRQPGSSFKPYIYAQAFAETENWGAGSIMYDVPTDFGGGYTPENYDRSFRGNMTVRSALAQSRNITAVKMLYITGLENTLELVEKMGITTLADPSNYGLSLVLGAGEVQLNQHVNAFETFANGGMHRDQVTILEILDSNGEVIEEWEEDEGERIFEEEVAYLISDILSDDSARAPTFGSNSPYFNIPGHTVAAKTGTTDNFRDGWLLGYSCDLTAGVWAGHSDNDAMTVATDGLTGPIFSQFMRDALDGNENCPFERPDGVKSVTLDRYTGNVPSDDSESTVTDIFPSWYQPRTSQGVESAVINSANNKLATECTPEAVREEVYSYGIQAEIPRDDPAFYRWDAPVQAFAERQDIGSGSIPTEEDDCEDDDPVSIRSFDAEYDEGDDEIIVELSVRRGTYDIDEVTVRRSDTGENLSLDDRSGGRNRTYTYIYDTSDDNPGSYSFEAVVTDEGGYRDTASTQQSTSWSGEIGGGRRGIGAIPFLQLNWLFPRL